MTIIYAGISDIGQKRKTNQDSICLSPEISFFAVADGMGGHNGGDIASQMAVKILPEYLKQHGQDSGPDRLKAAIKDVNAKIHAHGKEHQELKGMGTTIVACLIDNGELHIGNVGDSRAYLFSNKRVFQLTRDHSLVQEKLSLGIYNRQQAKQDPQKNVLIRTVGYEPEVDVDLYKYKIQVNDLFLLCSDGLSGKVHGKDMLTLMEPILNKISDITQDDLQSMTQQLVDLANKNGGQDNISVILILVQGKSLPSKL